MQSGHQRDITDYYGELNPPSVQDQSLQLEQLVNQGVLTPEQAQAAQAGRSDMNNIQTDPSLRSAQIDALNGLQDISKTGLTASDQAALDKIKSDEATTSKGSRDAIIQGAQQRGLGGSGLDLMAQLQNQQSSATRASQRDEDVAGQAQNRALQALIQAGSTAGNIQQQDFSQGAAKASANDAISKFNAQNQQQTNMANMQANNAAQATNLANKQAVANTNVQTNNAQQQYNKQLLEQQYNDRMRMAAARTGVDQTNSNIGGNNSKNKADADNKTIGSVMTAVSALSDERAKEKIEQFNPSDFLDSLTGYKYEYKDKKHGAGKKVGVMAQDLEKSDIGSQFVDDSPDGKVVNYGKAAPAMMAALADLNKRVKKVEGA